MSQNIATNPWTQNADGRLDCTPKHQVGSNGKLLRLSRELPIEILTYIEYKLVYQCTVYFVFESGLHYPG